MNNESTNPLNSYLRDGEYFLWLGTGRTNFKCPIPLAIFWLIFSLIGTVLGLSGGIKGLFVLPFVAFVAVGIWLVINSFKEPRKEYYAVTNSRVMSLKGKCFESENLNDIIDVKIQKIHSVNEKYSNIEYLVQLSEDSAIHSPSAQMRFRCDKNFNHLENSEAEYVKDLIISKKA